MSERVSNRSVERVSQLSQSSESHERTNERTDVEGTHLGDHPAALVTRTHAYGDLTDLIDETADALELASRRMPVIRTGEREPIHPWVRKAVYQRDNYECCWCHCRFVEPIHLDHIIPWSAGGSDDSSNLRTLCETCNENRSNYATDSWTRVTPVGVCDECSWTERGVDTSTAIFCAVCHRFTTTTSEGSVW